jgi:hypothetical protein
VGDTHTLVVLFDDGTLETYAPSVTDLLALPVLTSPTGTGSTMPNFVWSAPVPAPSIYTQEIRVHGNSGDVWDDRYLSPSTTTLQYNVDGSGGTLQAGSSYNWQISVQDGHGNNSQGGAMFMAQ